MSLRFVVSWCAAAYVGSPEIHTKKRQVEMTYSFSLALTAPGSLVPMLGPSCDILDGNLSGFLDPSTPGVSFNALMNQDFAPVILTEYLSVLPFFTNRRQRTVISL